MATGAQGRLRAHICGGRRGTLCPQPEPGSSKGADTTCSRGLPPALSSQSTFNKMATGPTGLLRA